MSNDYNKDHTQDAIKEHGEVFTPEWLVEEMLAKLPQDILLDCSKTVIDNSCGSGNFLVKVLELRMKDGNGHESSLQTTYGVELDQDNCNVCKSRLSLGNQDKEIWDILNRNIICADALDPAHSGWNKVGFYWIGQPAIHKFFVSS